MFCDVDVDLPSNIKSILSSFPEQAQYKPAHDMVLRSIVQNVASGKYHITVRDRISEELFYTEVEHVLNQVDKNLQVIIADLNLMTFSLH